MQRGIIIVLFILVLFIIDWYIFSALKQLIRNWSIPNQKIASYAYWFLPVLCIAIAMILLFAHQVSNKVKYLLASIILISYVSKVFAALILLSGDLIKLINIGYNKIQEFFTNSNEQAIESPKISRSDFIAKASLAVGATHIGAMTWGIISGAHDYRIRRIPLILPNLPKEFNGLKLIQISDIHAGSFYNKTAVEGGVDMILKEKPDLVFFTGDLVNNKAEELQSDYFNIFKRIEAPLGVYSTFGNHDYGDYSQWSSEAAKIQNLKDLAEAHRLMGWNLMMDENQAITVDGASIGVLGIQNWGAGGFIKKGNLSKALKNTEHFETKLLLSHDPSHWREQVLNYTNIDVSFAGHTHGMQYGIEIGDFKWSPVQYRYKEWAGLYKENNQQLYVNRGYGFLGYPGRLGILPEISVFELKRS